jgi:endonuclease YncB( thermonuclease family)
MLDLIGGRVLSVIDGDTFELQVFCQDPGNSFECQRTEQILIASIDRPELGMEEGARKKLAVEARLLGRMVVCEVLSRDRRRRLVCCVHTRDQSKPPGVEAVNGPGQG